MLKLKEIVGNGSYNCAWGTTIQTANLLAVASRTKLTMYDVTQGESLQLSPLDSCCFESLNPVLAWGAGILAGATDDDTVVLWNAENLQKSPVKFKTGVYSKLSLCFSPTQQHYLATACAGQMIVWDVETLGKLTVYYNVRSFRVKWSHQSNLLGNACFQNADLANRSLKLWDLNSKDPVREFSSVTDFDWSPKDTNQILTTNGQHLHLRDLRNLDRPIKECKCPNDTQRIAWSPHDASLVVCCGESASAWNIDTGTRLTRVTEDPKGTLAQWSPQLPDLFSLVGNSGLSVFTTTHQKQNKPNTVETELTSESQIFHRQLRTLQDSLLIETKQILRDHLQVIKPQLQALLDTLEHNNKNVRKKLEEDVRHFKSQKDTALVSARQKGNQCAQRGEYDIAKAYFQIALYEGKSTLTNDELAQIQREKDEVITKGTKAHKAEVDRKLQEVQEHYNKIANKNTLEAQAIKQQRDQLEKEKQLWNQKIAEMQRKEDELEKRKIEFERQCQAWNSQSQTKAALNAAKKSDTDQLVENIRQSNADVIRGKAELEEKLLEAEAARTRLTESERELKEQVECLKHFLSIIEQQGNLPEAVNYRKHLKSIKHLKGRDGQKKVKCFISYAWQPDPKDNAVLQARLQKLKGDLNTAGIEVMLDIHSMEGDVNRYMRDGIQSSDRVLLICTPRLKTRAEQGNNNLRTELDEALVKQKCDPKFIIPLILEGDRRSAVTSLLPTRVDILTLDLSDPKEYCTRMTSLVPKGLIPMLLGLEGDKLYRDLLRGYHAEVQVLNNTLKKV